MLLDNLNIWNLNKLKSINGLNSASVWILVGRILVRISKKSRTKFIKRAVPKSCIYYLTAAEPASLGWPAKVTVLYEPEPASAHPYSSDLSHPYSLTQAIPIEAINS